MWRLFSHSTRRNYCVIHDSLSALNRLSASQCRPMMSTTRDSSATWYDASSSRRHKRSVPHGRSHASVCACWRCDEMPMRRPHCRCCTKSCSCCRSSSTCLDDSRTLALSISLAMTMRSTFFWYYKETFLQWNATPLSHDSPGSPEKRVSYTCWRVEWDFFKLKFSNFSPFSLSAWVGAMGRFREIQMSSTRTANDTFNTEDWPSCETWNQSTSTSSHTT